MLANAFRHARQNLGIVVLALLLAFVIWIAASLQTDPFSDRRFTNLAVNAVLQPEDTVFLTPPLEQVAVMVRARESTLAELRASSFQATLDLSRVEPGVPLDVPVLVTCASEAVRILAVDPPAYRVDLAAIETVTRPVTIQVQGHAATGFGLGGAAATPDQVAIHGPALLLSQVVSVTAPIEVEGARREVAESIAVRLLDRSGNAVEGLEVLPQQVRVRVPVVSLAEYKPDIRVVAIVRGEPADGYRRGDVSVTPPMVTLEGPSLVLDRLPDFVETLPITITGATESLSRQSLISVPAEVSVVEVSYVTVTVQVLPILGTRVMTGTVEMLRVLPGMRAIPIPAVVTVTLEGPDARLEALKAEDLLIVLDLRGFPAGMRRVIPDVLVPEGVAILSVDPETIVVIIEPVPTPTPVPTAPPTPTPGP